MSTKTLQIIGGQKFVQSDWNVTDPTSPLYIRNKPVMSGEAIVNDAKVINITIPAASWVGTGPYSQVLDIDSATASTKLDIQADTDTMATILNKGYCMSIKNDNGTVTIHAIGTKPTVDLNVQLMATEVIGSDSVIWGDPLIGSSRGFIVSAEAPANTNMLWIDIANGLKYYNGSAWVAVPMAY